MSSKRPSGQHMPQLDGLRTLAVAGVAWSHWMGPQYQFGLDWGVMGVNLFFVLSGFLITGILLDSRAGAAGRWAGRWLAIRQFYARRVLRIFPLFYMTLVLLALVNVRPVRQTFVWHVCYLSNVCFFRQGGWQVASHISHFWSLAVEEQFYLVWPYLMIFLPFRLLRPVVMGLIGLAPLFRVVMCVAMPENKLASVLTIGCLDALGIGALLAYAQRSGGDSPRTAQRLGRRLLWIGLPAWVALEGLNRWHLAPGPLLQMRQTFLDMIFGWVILNGARGFKSWFGPFLQWSPMAYLGKISYGLYVFHNLAIYAVVFAVRDLHAPAAILNIQWMLHLELAILTISAAAISWHFYEKPLNDLKRYFPYDAPVRAKLKEETCESEIKKAAPDACNIKPRSQGGTAAARH